MMFPMTFVTAMAMAISRFMANNRPAPSMARGEQIGALLRASQRRHPRRSCRPRRQQHDGEHRSLLAQGKRCVGRLCDEAHGERHVEGGAVRQAVAGWQRRSPQPLCRIRLARTSRRAGKRNFAGRRPKDQHDSCPRSSGATLKRDNPARRHVMPNITTTRNNTS